MPVAIHRDLQGSMSRKRLHRLRCQLSFDPTRDGEVSEAMPIELLDSRKLAEEGPETPFDQIIMAEVTTFPASAFDNCDFSFQCFSIAMSWPDKGTVRTPAVLFGAPSSR